MTQQTHKDLSRKTRTTLFVVLAAIALLCVAYALWFGMVNSLRLSRVEPTAWAEFGDFIGGIANPIVGLFALYWLTESIRVQRQELADTREILNVQSESDNKRNFETTFFALLTHLNSLHGRLKTADSQGVNELSYVHTQVFGQDSLESANETLNGYADICSHYFISLYQALKFVASHFSDNKYDVIAFGSRLERSRPSPEEKFYSNILRASLDSKTSQLLAVNGYSYAHQQSFWLYKVLVERYALLEHMPFEVHPQARLHEALLTSWTGFYEARAFGKSDYIAKLRELGFAP